MTLSDGFSFIHYMFVRFIYIVHIVAHSDKSAVLTLDSFSTLSVDVWVVHTLGHSFITELLWTFLQGPVRMEWNGLLKVSHSRRGMA